MFSATLDLRLVAMQADHQLFDSKEDSDGGGAAAAAAFQTPVWDTLEKSADLLMQVRANFPKWVDSLVWVGLLA